MDHLLKAVKEVQEHLDRAGIASALIGGLAVAAWGDPRVTRDVDFKVDAERGDVERVLRALPPGYAPADSRALGFARSSGILFVQASQGPRVDLLLADVGFDHLVVGRAVEAEIQPGEKARVCTPEDLILYKLISTRPRDHADAQSIVRRQGACLDHAYVEEWLRQFELALDDSTLVSTYRHMRGIE